MEQQVTQKRSGQGHDPSDTDDARLEPLPQRFLSITTRIQGLGHFTPCGVLSRSTDAETMGMQLLCLQLLQKDSTRGVPGTDNGWRMSLPCIKIQTELAFTVRGPSLRRRASSAARVSPRWHDFI
jgi:hypothetical protein